MALLPRCVAVVAWTTLSVAPSLAQQISGTASVRANAIPMSQAAPSVSAPPWFFQRYGIGTFGSPLGFGGRVAASLTDSLNLRVGLFQCFADFHVHRLLRLLSFWCPWLAGYEARK